ncbi:thiamine phosphate synthase [Vibrio panuliri]|uniref:Thiamine-phosphate synthase n=1 Tax=Vibrio panuliri TaxID=1381081 RepID=A0ABX3F344_9VIBR|nr:thiamine phosphate synthase [Vibrio panuliri]KAB1460367.1 thiamine phosphate synthase [Vibrio panuliri]OLQ84097.1 thiamine-phosphate diphosphorylase [Vibrio panuliri]
MTVSILVPSSKIELTGEIQQALILAKQQGLAIGHIELGVSSTQYLLIQTEQSELVIGSDLWSCSSRDCDCYIEYHSDQLNHPIKSNTVYLGMRDGARWLDIWTHSQSVKTRALAYMVESQPSEYDCHLAWIVALLSLDFPLEDSLTLARSKMNVSRETWPSDYQYFPQPVLEHKALGISVGWIASSFQQPFGNVDETQLGLYPVVDNVEWVEKLLKLGIKTIQLRVKDPNVPDLEQQIIDVIELGKRHQAQVFINDYWQLAVKHRAYGVHLGQEDLEVANISQLHRADIRLGLSTHGYYELLRIVQLKPSYIALGHIFPTTTKQMPSKPQGLVRLALYQALINTIPKVNTECQFGYPTVAIGGIDLTNAEQVWRCGVTSLAVVRALTQAESPQDVIRQFDDIMQSGVLSTEEVMDVN